MPKLFQFHKVRLKGSRANGFRLWISFQFHKVRLKVKGKRMEETFDQVSIPQGTIKRRRAENETR